ncbi:MAG: AAA family ATPase [Zhongshania sp.]|uniref:ATP-dependent DNA helicase n=1 Tax=Spongiibacter sp. IMCC21906 TaxID=1620392 RepID=UPI00062DEADA|nr:AAA family ATPase [Spongiibacter sp. IMCC21906]AKH68807.1 UvrD-like helicase C-terminal domain/AAA domain [Spongiibacter sp. IMCC21906]MBQ0758385.1 AAA family ATPase [Zhongshania sp.]
MSSSKLIDLCVTEGALLRVNGGLQSLGYAVQENTVANLITGCASRRPGDGALLSYQEQDLTEQKIKAAISAFEETLNFSLTPEQKDAVLQAVINPVAIICGGAGTGKTTILLAILEVYDKLVDQLPQYLVALSGRAARRMSEATGRPALTIAKLLAMHAGEDKEPLPDALLLIVDEASMVDLLSMYRLAGALPEATRILLVGDAAQLPPVGVGLIFHDAIACNKLTLIELTAVQRQKSTSGIHHLATNIRNGVFDPSLLNSTSGDVSYTYTDSPNIVVKHFRSHPDAEQTIILVPTRKGPMGADQINKLIQATFDQPAPEIHHLFRGREMIPWLTSTGAKLRLGDRVMVTENKYDADIRNGDIGAITAVYPEMQVDQSLGELTIDGRSVPITIDILPILELGYAITIHKSQGSQWDTCLLVLPTYAQHMIDQTLIYTGITRAVNSLVIMGDSVLLQKAVERGPSNEERNTDLAAKLTAF